MPRPLAFFASVVAASLALGALAFSAAWWLGDRKLARMVEVRVVPVSPARDAPSLKQGRYLYETRGCAKCHGQDGAGAVAVDDPGGLYARAPNITSGHGGIGAIYTDGDWVRAIRHGVDPNGHALLLMPSDDFSRMTDADLAALVGYVKSLPPAAGGPAVIRMPAFAKALYGLGGIRDAAEKIDHRLPPPAPVPAAANVEHGQYLATMCMGCHGPRFAGGRIPGSPPAWPPAPNLTPGPVSGMAAYDTPAKFAAMMREGRRPDGTAVNSIMPFEALSQLNDVDLQGLYAYLRTLPAITEGRR